MANCGSDLAIDFASIHVRTINIGADGSRFGHFHLHSTDNKSLADGTMVNLMGAYFLGQGNITQSVALPCRAIAWSRRRKRQ